MDDDSVQPDPRGDYGGQVAEASRPADHDDGPGNAGSGEFASGHHEPVADAASADLAAVEPRRDREPPLPPRAEEG